MQLQRTKQLCLEPSLKQNELCLCCPKMELRKHLRLHLPNSPLHRLLSPQLKLTEVFVDPLQFICGVGNGSATYIVTLLLGKLVQLRSMAVTVTALLVGQKGGIRNGDVPLWSIAKSEVNVY